MKSYSHFFSDAVVKLVRKEEFGFAHSLRLQDMSARESQQLECQEAAGHIVPQSVNKAVTARMFSVSYGS